MTVVCETEFDDKTKLRCALKWRNGNATPCSNETLTSSKLITIFDHSTLLTLHFKRILHSFYEFFPFTTRTNQCCCIWFLRCKVWLWKTRILPSFTNPCMLHQSSKDTKIGNYHIPKGTHVMVNIYAINCTKVTGKIPMFSIRLVFCKTRLWNLKEATINFFFLVKRD